MKKKDHIINATDIVPDAIYMYVSGRVQIPVKVKCTLEQGWLRGFVEVTNTSSFGTEYIGSVTLINLRAGNSFGEHVMRKRHDDPWTFRSVQYFYLRKFDTEWLKKELELQEYRLSLIQKDVDILKSLQA